MRKLLLSATFMLLWIGTEHLFAQTLPAYDIDSDRSFVLDSVQVEVNQLLRLKAELAVDDLERFLKRESGSMASARVFAQKYADQVADALRTKTRQKILRRLRELDGTTFTINRREMVLDGKQNEKPCVDVELKIDGRALEWHLVYPHRGYFGSVYVKELPFSIEKQDGWKESLTDVSDDQLAAFNEFKKQRQNSRLENSIYAFLLVELDLELSQRQPMKDWLKNRIDVPKGFGTIDRFQHVFNVDELFEETPKFLSKSQKAKWRLIQFNPNPLGR